MIAVLGVHGINTPQDFDYASSWQKILKCPVAAARWESTGTIGRDVLKVTLNHAFQKRQVERLAKRVFDFNAGLQASKTAGVIVAHSMGEPLVLAAERELRLAGAGTCLDYITIGGPLSHPIWGSSLRAVGLGRPTAQTPIRFWNYDDGVCCSRLAWSIQPSWCINRRVAVAGDTGFFVEHPAELYLSNPNVKRAIYERSHSRG